MIVDSGVLYAFADADDRWREPVRRLFENTRVPLLVPYTILPEVLYMVNKALGAKSELDLLLDLTQGPFQIVWPEPEDFHRCIEILREYSDADLGFVDASVVAIAERLGIRRIATTDRRDFSLVRPKHCGAFELLP
ncbi:MAG: PIN domain-containing protein [Bdellovibrionota bacterium]